MTKPTEGPYRVNKYGSIGAGPLGTTPIIATVEPFYGADKKHGDQAANARLLAKSWEMRECIKALLDRDEINTCDHPETYRGGNIWEICHSCGAKWADDEGGKPEWKDPPEWTAARALLRSIEGE